MDSLWKRPSGGRPRRNTVGAMRRLLEEHSPLEDLGPLFGTEAQGGLHALQPLVQADHQQPEKARVGGIEEELDEPPGRLGLRKWGECGKERRCTGRGTPAALRTAHGSLG